MTYQLHVLFVAPPDGEQAMATVREQSNIVVESVPTATEAHERLHTADCVICTADIPDMDVVSFLEAVQQSRPSLTCLLFSETVNRVFEDVLEKNLADWIPAAGGGKALANRVAWIAMQVRQKRRLTAVQESVETLATAETEDTVAETAVRVVSSVLNYSAAIVARYDGEAGTLRPVAWEGVAEPDDELFATDGGLGWTAFLENEVRHGNRENGSAFEQWLAIPLGRHGVLAAAQEAEQDPTVIETSLRTSNPRSLVSTENGNYRDRKLDCRKRKQRSNGRDGVNPSSETW
ncbi:hypothetical protein [Haladaptatus sp. DFWS20]|uniref:GAF domain-containing protein n=1 Tax=Haladaptatus sp. DFWS20 TaxID=3403467 RepID=UPI003EBC0F80